MITRGTKFKIVEDIASGDFIFDAYGDDPGTLFSNCGWACFCAMTDPRSVKPGLEFQILLDGENLEELLFKFLSELIYIKDVEKVFLSEFLCVVDESAVKLNAVVKGEKIDYNNHLIKTDVKAVAFHDLDIKRGSDGYSVRIILDL